MKSNKKNSKKPEEKKFEEKSQKDEAKMDNSNSNFEPIEELSKSEIENNEEFYKQWEKITEDKNTNAVNESQIQTNCDEKHLNFKGDNMFFNQNNQFDKIDFKKEFYSSNLINNNLNYEENPPNFDYTIGDNS